MLLLVSKSVFYLWISGSNQTTSNLLLCFPPCLKIGFGCSNISSALYFKNKDEDLACPVVLCVDLNRFYFDVSLYSMLMARQNIFPAPCLKRRTGRAYYDLWLFMFQIRTALDGQTAFKIVSNFSSLSILSSKHILQNYDFLALCLKITKYGLYILRSFCLKMIQMRVHVWIGIWNDLKYLFGTSLCSPLDRFARSECFMALSQNSTRETPCSILLSPQK